MRRTAGPPQAVLPGTTRGRQRTETCTVARTTDVGGLLGAGMHEFTGRRPGPGASDGTSGHGVVRTYETAPVRDGDRLGAVVDAQLHQHAADVGLDGSDLHD
jgi:hypothetical protein